MMYDILKYRGLVVSYTTYSIPPYRTLYRKYITYYMNPKRNRTSTENCINYTSTYRWLVHQSVMMSYDFFSGSGLLIDG